MEKQINAYILKWEQRCYPDGIPDEAPKEIDEMVPSYKRIVMAILRNDVKLLGITPPHSKWYDHYKRIEIQQRNGTMETSL